MLTKLRGGFPGEATITGSVWGSASLGTSEGQPTKACAFPQHLKSSTSSSHTMTLRSLSSLAQESQLSTLGTLSKHLPSALAIKQEIGEADNWKNSLSQHHKSTPSICIGQTELCQSPVQGLGVPKPASFQMAEKEKSSL